MTFIGEQVTRRRREQTGVDRAAGPIYTWVDVVLDARCAFDPGGSTEPLEVGRAQVITVPTAYFLCVVDVVAGDRLLIRGRDLAVKGEPAVWVSPWHEDVTGTVVELQKSTEEG